MSLLSRLAVQAARAYGILSSADKTKVAASYLVVAGGGGGGGSQGGGGGAGGYQTSTFTLSTLNTYSITVGAGGNGGTNVNGTSGSNSVISGTGLTTVTSTGGGYGGGEANAGASGGSGGGGGAQGGSGAGGSATSGQGFAGGSGSNPNAGGGGGSSQAGNTASQRTGGNGTASSISGSSVTYAGGGGGGSNNGTTSSGGTGGGGGGTGNTTAGTAGTVNLGGGGGGGGSTAGVGNGAGGAGGSGIVIISYASASPKFVGGTLTTSGGNQIHTFTSSGTLSPLTPVTASYLVVAGGGGGALGGGGAGGYQTSSTTLYSSGTYVVTVGAGGTAGTVTSTNGGQGNNSVLSGIGLTTITSTGGGYAGSSGGQNGGNGGSGGGGGSGNSGGTGTSGQGNNGGAGIAGNASPYSGGGGGGASVAGGNGSGSAGGSGGNGTSSSISGSSVTYAGGGGGGVYLGGYSGGTAGTGGGGAGASGAAGSSGTPNTGGGGGGAGNTFNGGTGGSGTVIISYAGSQVFNGGLVTSSGGNTIHTFNATGALTPLTNNLKNSLRFRSSASAYLNRTPTVAGSQTTWTWSGWVKRGTLGSQQKIFTAGSSGSLFASFEFIAGDNFQFYAYNGSTNAYLVTTQVFRDPSAWYHINFVCDTTQATAANRVKIYINGTQVTAFSTSTYPSQNFAFPINNSVIHNIGRDNINVTNYFDGYMTDINFIDGQALEPYYFGNNDANGVWKPIKYTGMYGTNGFYLTFGNTTSTTTLGYDSSGNGNNWTTNNISLTAGTTYDAMTDVPTNTSATVANYSTWLALRPTFSQGNYQNANLEWNQTSAGSGSFVCSSIGVFSGKWYAEFSFSGSVNSTSSFVGFGTMFNIYGLVGYRADGKTEGGATFGASFTTGDILGVAYDQSTNTATFYKNNVSQGTQSFTIDQTLGGAFVASTIGNGSTIIANFGQRPFTYTPPTGFVALNTYNLPTPTILQGNKYMDATLYTGTGTSQVIVNQGQFKPDFVWIKSRNNITNNNLTDSVRGVTKIVFSNSSNAEATASVGVTSFDNNGFSLATGGDVGFSASGYTYVGWQWQAGAGTTSTNTSGSISSTVSVNSTAGFSVVTYTGTGANATVGHGLGVAPSFTAVKCRNDGTIGWVNYHASLGNTKFLNLNNSNAAATGSTVWNNTSPTSTTIALGTDSAVNGSTKTYVMYAWAEIAGFSKFGSWTNNGSTDGTFIYTGFAPAVILVKSSDAGESWYFRDNKRQTYNMTPPSNIWLQPNASSAEGALGATTAEIDTLSNGFKIRTTNTGSGEISFGSRNYIYAAWAENPFKNANAR